MPAAFGTQTGGSVLRPAAYCGVVGYKPTFNLINRAGIKFAAESLDTIGLIARTIDDVELITAVLVGQAAGATAGSTPRPALGVCRTPLWDTAQPETKARGRGRRHAARCRRRAGARDRAAGGVRAALSRRARDHQQLRALEEHGGRLGGHTRTRSARCWAIASGSAWRCGTRTTSPRCGSASTAARSIDDAFDGIDAIIAPCVKGEAPAGLGHTGDPAFQPFWTVLHVPTMTLPTHRGPNGLPVGIQLVAPRYEDERLFACARWVMERLS